MFGGQQEALLAAFPGSGPISKSELDVLLLTSDFNYATWSDALSAERRSSALWASMVTRSFTSAGL